MRKSRAARRFELAGALALAIAFASTSLAAGVGPQAASGSSLIPASAKVSCLYDKLSLEGRGRYQRYLLSQERSKNEAAALAPSLNRTSAACARQYGLSDKQVEHAGNYMAGRLIIEGRMASLPVVTQAQIPQMLGEIPAPLIAGWVAGHNEVELKYQTFLATFMQKYQLDQKTASKVLDVLMSASIVRNNITEFDRP